MSKLDLHDHIASLPDGLDTVITDRNLQFSGGQKQRLAIVRTLLMRPNLCIIDEGTSALDVQTEKATEMLLGELVGSCTLIRIAHKKILHLEPDARVLNL
jgi:ABC-type bacteriocin/lantibiotic exporter with double-glycine peptidase domain